MGFMFLNRTAVAGPRLATPGRLSRTDDSCYRDVQEVHLNKPLPAYTARVHRNQCALVGLARSSERSTAMRMAGMR
jgi:hypothetical protein